MATAKLVLETNKTHQAGLKSYVERLEDEIDALDKLLEATKLNDDVEEDEEVDVGGQIIISGSRRALELLTVEELSEKTSPFFDDTQLRQRYIDCTEYRPMPKQTLDALREAVRAENYRICAYEAQQRGEHAFTALAKHPPEYFEQNKEGIDWERVASRVSASSRGAQERTAQECKISWLWGLHPTFDHSPWSPDEIVRLKEVAGNVSNDGDGSVDWVQVAERLGTNRTPIDCLRHGIAQSRKPPAWTPFLDDRLRRAVSTYGSDNWYLVAKHVSESATPVQCQNRYGRLNLVREEWSAEEDDRLHAARDIYGSSWSEVASLVPGRTAEQCSDRWEQIERAEVARSKMATESARSFGRGTRWTRAEDAALMKAADELGVEDWQAITARLGNTRALPAYRRRYRTIQKQGTRASSASGSDASENGASTRRNEAGAPINLMATGGNDEQCATEAGNILTNVHQTQQTMTLPGGRKRPRPRLAHASATKVLSDKPRETSGTPVGVEECASGSDASQLQKDVGDNEEIASRPKRDLPRRTRGTAASAKPKPRPISRKRGGNTGSTELRTTQVPVGMINASETTKDGSNAS